MEDKILEFTGKTKEDLETVIEPLVAENDIAKAIISLLSMDDEQFKILAPSIMDSYQRSLNDPNEVIILTQAMNANGYAVEDLQELFSDTINALKNTDEISTIKKDFITEVLGSTIGAIASTEGISKRFVPVAIEFTDPRAKMPAYAHVSDSGADIYALEDITIAPGETKLIHTGLKAAIPPGYELQVRPKSGRSLKTKLRVANTPGTIKVA